MTAEGELCVIILTAQQTAKLSRFQLTRCAFHIGAVFAVVWLDTFLSLAANLGDKEPDGFCLEFFLLGRIEFLALWFHQNPVNVIRTNLWRFSLGTFSHQRIKLNSLRSPSPSAKASGDRPPHFSARLTPRTTAFSDATTLLKIAVSDSSD